jgi:hypothetical protein
VGIAFVEHAWSAHDLPTLVYRIRREHRRCFESNNRLSQRLKLEGLFVGNGDLGQVAAIDAAPAAGGAGMSTMHRARFSDHRASIQFDTRHAFSFLQWRTGSR